MGIRDVEYHYASPKPLDKLAVDILPHFFLIVVGEFNNQFPVVRDVNLGSPFNFACPSHKPSYGVSFTWEGKGKIRFKRNERRGISPDNGDLFIMFVTQDDIDEINGIQGIKCTMSAANTFWQSGALTLRKPAGRNFNTHKKFKNAFMHLILEVFVLSCTINPTLYVSDFFCSIHSNGSQDKLT